MAAQIMRQASIKKVSHSPQIYQYSGWNPQIKKHSKNVDKPFL